MSWRHRFQESLSYSVPLVYLLFEHFDDMLSIYWYYPRYKFVVYGRTKRTKRSSHYMMHLKT